MHVLFETGKAIDEVTMGDGTHEDDDFGSFFISVDSTKLLLDPGYLGWGKEKFTNAYGNHNVIQLDSVVTSNPIPMHSLANFSLTSSSSPYKSFRLSYVAILGAASINRYFRMLNNQNTVYYIVDDIVSSPTDHIKLNFNGNGNTGNSTFTSNGRQAKWLNGGWKLLLNVSEIPPESIFDIILLVK